MTSTITEVERKYAVPDDFVLPDLGPAVPPGGHLEGPDRIELDAVYYDTTDLRLIRSHVTLRRRTGGADAGWHLKLPGSEPGARLEVREPPGDVATVPEALAAPVLGLTGGRPLAPVTRITNTRTESRLVDGHGRVLAVLAEDQVRAEDLAGPGPGARWRELEVELQSGSDHDLDQIEVLLQKAGASRADWPSKLGRALGQAGQRPLVPPPPAVSSPAAPAGDVVTARLRQQVAALLRADVGVRRDEEEGVHDMRVAARRLRSALRTFGALFTSPTAGLATDLQWLGRALSPVRDTEVLRRRLHADLDALPAEQVLGPVKAELDGHLAAQQADVRETALAALTSDRYRDLVEALLGLAASPELGPEAAGPTEVVATRMVRRDRRRLARRMATAMASPAGETRDQAFHSVRKAAKRARYGAETLIPAYGKTAERYVAALVEIQDLLGDRQDAVVTRALLREQGARMGTIPGHNGYTYGLLAGLEACRIMADEEELGEAWYEADRKKVRRWLSGPEG